MSAKDETRNTLTDYLANAALKIQQPMKSRARLSTNVANIESIKRYRGLVHRYMASMALLYFCASYAFWAGFREHTRHSIAEWTPSLQTVMLIVVSLVCAYSAVDALQNAPALRDAVPYRYIQKIIISGVALISTFTVTLTMMSILFPSTCFELQVDMNSNLSVVLFMLIFGLIQFWAVDLTSKGLKG